MKIVKKMPQTPGVYLMKDARGRILYIGKAGNLRRRVASYWEKPREARLEVLLQKIAKIDYKKTDTALEALILEVALIRKHQPPYNIREKDDKSFLWVEISKEKWPRVLLARGRDPTFGQTEVFGPFTSASSIREALRIIRRIFPYNIHSPEKLGRFQRPCFDYEIGLCPGTCVDTSGATHSRLRRNVGMISLLFLGKKKKIIRDLEKEMAAASRKLDFESAQKTKKQLFALKHIQDIALIGERDSLMTSDVVRLRVEGYDVSNIAGAAATGAMVVFQNGESAKNEYRKFKIRNFTEPNDIGMLQEMLRRRLRHQEWPLPDLILIDGGQGQINAAKKALEEFAMKIPVVGIAKGPRRRNNKFTKEPKDKKTKELLIKIRDEAHRFAIKYHRHLSTVKALAPAKAVL